MPGKGGVRGATACDDIGGWRGHAPHVDLDGGLVADHGAPCSYWKRIASSVSEARQRSRFSAVGSRQ